MIYTQYSLPWQGEGLCTYFLLSKNTLPPCNSAQGYLNRHFIPRSCRATEGQSWSKGEYGGKGLEFKPLHRMAAGHSHGVSEFGCKIWSNSYHWPPCCSQRAIGRKSAVSLYLLLSFHSDTLELLVLSWQVLALCTLHSSSTSEICLEVRNSCQVILGWKMLNENFNPSGWLIWWSTGHYKSWAGLGHCYGRAVWLHCWQKGWVSVSNYRLSVLCTFSYIVGPQHSESWSLTHDLPDKQLLMTAVSWKHLYCLLPLHTLLSRRSVTV